MLVKVSLSSGVVFFEDSDQPIEGFWGASNGSSAVFIQGGVDLMLN